MANEPELSETDEVVVHVMSLLIGAVSIVEPRQQAGFDQALAHIRDYFLTHKKSKAARLTESILRIATDNRSDPALLNMLRASTPGGPMPT